VRKYLLEVELQFRDENCWVTVLSWIYQLNPKVITDPVIACGQEKLFIQALASLVSNQGQIMF
jgi:hypothetical protein